MAELADDIDVTLLALVSYLQRRIFLLEGKTAQQAERLTRRVVALAYRMAFGEKITGSTSDSIDRAADGLLAAINVLDDLIAEEEREEVRRTSALGDGGAVLDSD